MIRISNAEYHHLSLLTLTHHSCTHILWPLIYFPTNIIISLLIIYHRTSVPLSSSNDQYVCLHVGCDRSFSRSHDLKRHGRIHFPDSATWIDCEGKGCGRVGRPQQGEKGGFSRRDHYVEHLRKVHKKDIPKGRGSGKNAWVPVNSLSIVA